MEILSQWEAELEDWREEKNVSNTFGRDASDTIYYRKMKTLIDLVRKKDEALKDIADESYGYSSVQKHFAREALALTEELRD